MIKCYFLSCILLLMTSCTNEILTVHMDYISHANLASTYVGTPDPLLETPLVGQRLVVSWYIPVSYREYDNFSLKIFLRYGNREEATALIPFKRRQGWYVYALTNEDFFDKKGIKTYFVQLFQGDQLIDHWQHQLWVNLIEFAPEETEKADDNIEDDDAEEIENDDDSYIDHLGSQN